MGKKCCSLFLIGVFLLQMCSFSVFAQDEAGPAILYVATNGNDANDGTIDAPFATLERARDEIRDMKTGYRVPEKGVVVYVRGGVYNRLTSFSLLSQDSGTEKGPIVYRAYPGEEVSLVGGVNLDAAQFSKITDAAVQERIIDTNARSKVLQANLASMGVTDYGAINLRGVYSYEMPGMEQYRVPTPPELFFNGASMTLARYPNDGYLNIDKVIHPGAHPRMWEDDKANDPAYVPPEERDLSDGFVIGYKDERISKWAAADELRLHGFWFYDWADQSMPAAIDPQAKTITTTIPSRYQVRAGQRYYAYNLLEELDSPGEYYIDRSSGMLYFYPPGGMNADVSVQLSLLSDYLIDMDGASHVQIKNLSFTAMRGGAIRTTAQSASNLIEGCTIENTGAYAVYLDGTDNGIVSSHIRNTDGGLRLTGGDRNTLTPAGNYAENNHIEEFARLTKTYTSGIDFAKGVGNRARYNRIHGADHQAVGYGGNDHLLAYNEIYDVLRHADDAGVVYSVGDWTCRGMEFKYNYIHDISSVSETGLTGVVFAFYFDNRISGSQVVGNIIENVPGGVFQHGGRDLKMVNNILINVQQAARISTTALGGNDGSEAYGFLHALPYLQEPWKSKYPELSGVPEEQLLEPENNHVENNLIVNTDGSAGSLPAAHATITNVGNLQLKKDPGFYDMNKQNYLLKQDAAVFEENPDFHALPFTRMGMYSERALQRVANAITMVAGSPQTLIGGKQTWVDKNDWSKKPQIIEDRTYVPLRFIGESFGAKVEWNGETREITIADTEKTILAQADSTDATVNGEAVVLQAPVRIIDGTSYVPLRSVAELLGKSVYWNDIGLITISDNEALFSEKSDTEIISYLHGLLDIY